MIFQKTALFFLSGRLPELAKAILSVFPLDSFVSEPVFRMEVVGKPDELVGCHKDMRNILDETSDRRWEIGSIERHAFYERAKNAYAVVCAAGERETLWMFHLYQGSYRPRWRSDMSGE